MKRKIFALILLFAMLSSLCSCANKNTDSTFSIQFIDVGQGDSALIECDGRYMLIDGGDVSAGDKVYSVLKERGIRKLDILVISHLHEDHFGGLTKALTYVEKIGRTISNAKGSEANTFSDFEHELYKVGSKITTPVAGDKYKLGSAKIEVIDARSEKKNDSLVLLITYGETTFLFAGDMEQNQESQICNRYGDEIWNISLLKIAHHGSKTSTSIRFLSMLMPEYAVISVGQNRQPDHPSKQTLDRLEQADVKEVYRTDVNGDIIVKSNGKEISIETSK